MDALEEDSSGWVERVRGLFPPGWEGDLTVKNLIENPQRVFEDMVSAWEFTEQDWLMMLGYIALLGYTPKKFRKPGGG